MTSPVQSPAAVPPPQPSGGSGINAVRGTNVAIGILLAATQAAQESAQIAAGRGPNVNVLV